MNPQTNSNHKKYLFTALVSLIFVSIVLAAVSYALFSETLFGKKQYGVESQGLRIYLEEENKDASIFLENAIPVTDVEGRKNEPYNFSLVNDESQDLNYIIYLKEDAYENKTPASAIRYYYTRDVNDIQVTRNIADSITDDGRYILEEGAIASGKIYHYTFRMWIDYNAGNEILNTKYSVRLEVEAMQTSGFYKEVVLGGADPVLTDNLVPVKIGDSGVVKRADLYDEWYNYEKQIWANAVVLEDKTKEYAVGEVIPDDNIQGYFVWIPRYRYKIFDVGNHVGTTGFSDTAVQTIEVVFENKDTVASSGTEKDEWLTHPAFQAFDTNGFWVGKFETGYKGATTAATAQVNSSDSSKIVIRPNVFSWRNITLGNAFKASYDYLRSDESHMMKNTEWGAVAYLQHSIYGSHASVRINNNSSYKTGYAAVIEPTLGYSPNSISGNQFGTAESVTLPYNTKAGYMASTTGNISGIYDMSGGAFEYVMGYNQNANSVGGSSGLTGIYGDFFSNSRWDKYYDRYTSSSETAYNNRILGDATGEMGPFGNVRDSDSVSRHRSSWYGDYAHFINLTNPWFYRGGAWSYGVGAGVFNFSYYTGGVTVELSFRLVLAP